MKSKSARSERAATALRLLELMAVGTALLEPSEEEKRSELLLLMATMSHQNKTLFKKLLKTNKPLLREVLALSPEEASTFQHSLHLTTSQRRKMATVFTKVWDFNPLPSEQSQASWEDEVNENLSDKELEHGKMPLYHSSKDDAPRMAYYARVRSLTAYLAKEISSALEEDWTKDPDNMRNLRCERYGGEIWVRMGGDKGGGSTKITASLGGGREALVLAIFQGAEISSNLITICKNYIPEMHQLRKDGLEVLDPLTGQLIHMPVKLLLFGDMAFESEACGHSGSAAVWPSLYRMISRAHLQKAHRNGEPHIPGEEGCDAEWRKMQEMDKDYLANQRTNCTPKMMAKKARHFHSIKGMQIIPVEDVLHIVTAALHIALLLGVAIIKLLEGWSDVLDDKANEADLANVWPEGDSEEQCEEDASDAESGDEERGPSSAGRPGAVDGEKARAETELHLKQQEVQEQEQEMVKLATRLEQLNSLKERVILCEEGRWQEQEEMARTTAKDKRPLQRFDFCGDLCLLTLHDRSVQKKTCSVCHRTCHATCQLMDAILVEGEPGPLTCLACRPDPITTYSGMKNVVTQKVQEVKNELTMATVKVEQVRSEESYLRGKLAKWVGPLRRRLLELLENVLKVVRAAYHGGTFVGAHVEKILKHHEELSTVLDSRPDIKDLFNEFCATYLVSHGLMKRAGWLEPHEVWCTAVCVSMRSRVR